MNEPLRLSRAQVREIDRRSIEEFHISGIVLMENAARAVTKTAMRFVGPGKRALILCGGGNNGGDGLAVARHLQNRGVQVSIGLTIPPEKYHGDALTNWKIVQTMHLAVSQINPAAILQSRADLVIDAIFGTGLDRSPRPPFADIVRAVKQLGAPVLAVDLPSGMDCDTGESLGECMNASVTVTFVAEKIGFGNPTAMSLLGEVVVGDIGCPIELLNTEIL